MLSPDVNKLQALVAIYQYSRMVTEQPDEAQRVLSAAQMEEIRVEICQQAGALSGKWCPEMTIKTNFNPDGTVIVPGISPTA